MADKAELSYLSRLKFNPSLLKGAVAGYLKNFRITILLIIAVVFLGAAAFKDLPRRLNPEVKIPIVTVVTVLPGAGPEDVESLLSIPIENELNALKGIDTMSSLSRDSVSAVTIQFTSSTNRDDARDEVQRIVDGIRDLPEDAQTPEVTALDFENQPVWQFVLTTTQDTGTLQRFSKQLQEALEKDSDIDSVVLSGLEDQEVVVEIDPESLTRYGIQPLQLSALLKAGAKAIPAGSVKTQEYTYNFTINPQITKIDDIRNIRLTVSGTVIKLGDIAKVIERSKDGQNAAYVATQSGELSRVVSFNVYKTLSATITEGATAAKTIVQEKLQGQEDRFQIKTLTNTAEQIDEQFTDLLGEFKSTVLLVFVCLFLFLGLRQAIISSFTVPLTFLASFFFMQQVGMSINFLSLFAFLIALGLLVDDTIVVISAMTTYYKTGKFTPYQTGLIVWKDTIVPIWSTTITTIWSFIPLLLSTGIIGEFIKPIPVVVTITMLSSTAIAVLITLPIMILLLKPQFPARVVIFLKIISILLCLGVFIFVLRTNVLLLPSTILFVVLAFVFYRIRSVFLGRLKQGIKNNSILTRIHSFLARTSEHGVISLDGFSQNYQRFITRILKQPSSRKKVVLAVVLYAFVGFLLLPLGFVKSEFFPRTDAERLYIQVELPAGASLSATEEKVKTVFETVRSLPEADFFIIEMGKSAPSSFQMGSSASDLGLITIHLPPEEKRKKTSMEIAEQLRKTFQSYTDTKVTVVELSGGPPAGADLQMEISGENLETLSRYAESLVEYIQKQPGTTNPVTSLKQGTSAFVFVPDIDAITSYGLSLDAVGLWTRLFASGFTLDTVKLEDQLNDKIPVRFTFGTTSPSAESIGRLNIPTKEGSIPLTELGHFELQTNPTSITRKNGNRTITVTAGVRSGYSSTELNKKLEQFASTTLALTEGYTWKTGGANEENAKSVQSIIQAMGVALLLIMVTMVLQFRSFRQAMIVILVIPLAVSSVFYAFALTGTPLSFPALIGVLSLFGIVVTNSMFIVDKINLNQQEGMEFTDAIADAGASRMEPIILTKLATVLGLLPITLADPLWRGLGGAIISGLLIASTIMLLFIPVVYYQLFRKQK